MEEIKLRIDLPCLIFEITETIANMNVLNVRRRIKRNK